MNRRDAIAALTALPGLTRIQRADLRPTDVLVVEIDGAISHDTAERIKALIEEVWPGHKAVVLADGAKLKVLSGD